MSDPTKQPGYNFTHVRLLRAQYETISDPQESDTSVLGFGYKDDVSVDRDIVTIRQTVSVQLVAHRLRNSS